MQPPWATEDVSSLSSAARVTTPERKESGEAGRAHGDDSVDPLPTTSPESGMEGDGAESRGHVKLLLHSCNSSGIR